MDSIKSGKTKNAAVVEGHCKQRVNMSRMERRLSVSVTQRRAAGGTK